MRALAAAILILVAVPAVAQDTHYWNVQYGTHATLLGATVYETNSLTIENGVGTGRDLSSSSISPSFSFAAAAMKLSWLGENRVAISILTRQNMDLETSTRRIDTLDALPAVRSELVQQFLDLSNPQTQQVLAGTVSDTEMRVQRIKFLFGFIF